MIDVDSKNAKEKRMRTENFGAVLDRSILKLVLIAGGDKKQLKFVAGGVTLNMKDRDLECKITSTKPIGRHCTQHFVQRTLELGRDAHWTPRIHHNTLHLSANP